MRTLIAICLTVCTAATQSATDTSAVGSCAIKGSAVDAVFKKADPVLVTAHSPNQPPTVNAGPDVATVIPSAAHLEGTVTDDGHPGPLTIQWTQLSGPGTASFSAPTQPVTDAWFSLAGSYALELSAFDGQLIRKDTVVVMAEVASVTVDQAISYGNDDAVQRLDKVDRVSKALPIVFDRTANQLVGLRFANLSIPRGAVITSAHLQFTTEQSSSLHTRLSVAGEASNNALPFEAELNNISSRPRTAASVAWGPAPWTIVGQAGLAQRTSDLASVVQEITSRVGWCSGNAMVFVISGTGCRTAASRDNGRNAAPRLVVTYHM